MDFSQLHIISFYNRKKIIRKVAEDFMWQKERCDYPVMFPSLIAWGKKSLFTKVNRIYWATMQPQDINTRTEKDKKKVLIVDA